MLFRQILPEEERFMSSLAIHPLKQRSVAELVKRAKETPSVEYIAVFGSAITELCRPDSDVDIVVWDTEHKFIPPACDAFDKFYADELNEGYAIYHDVVEKGVVVYARDDVGCS